MIRLVLLSIFLSSCSGSQPPKYAPDSPLNRNVSNYEESGHDLEATVNELKEKFRVPVGMDLETLSDRRPIAINVPQGNVADVLNALNQNGQRSTHLIFGSSPMNCLRQRGEDLRRSSGHLAGQATRVPGLLPAQGAISSLVC
jgi:hypothetical protein